MLVALSDTHATTTPRLTDHLQGTLDRAAVVVHAGDFTTAAVLDAFEARVDLRGVYGNSDERKVCARLPETRTVEWAERRVVLVHGHRHDWTSLSLLARQEAADAVVMGHTHRPGIERRDGAVAVNPGSHADPRGRHATYALFERTESGVVGQIRTVDGQPLETVEL